LENLKRREHLEVLGTDRRIIFRWILVKWDVRVSIGFTRLRIRTSGGLL
jgi:hypothetical protein